MLYLVSGGSSAQRDKEGWVEMEKLFYLKDLTDEFGL
jgi:hypothetical protein